MKFSSTSSRIIPTSIVATLALVACSRGSDENQVRDVISRAEKAAEDRDASDVLAFVADDYTDKSGTDKAQLRDFLRGYFLVHPKLKVIVNIDSLEFPAAGLAKARIAVASVPLDQISSGDAVTLDVEFRKQGNDWRVSRADRVSR